MFCPKCHRQDTADGTYCMYCGALLNTVPAAPIAQPVAGMQTAPLPMPPAVIAEHPTVAPIKRLASSVLFLVAAVAFTLAAVFSLVSGVVGESSTLFADDEDWYVTGEEDLSDLWTDPGNGGFEHEGETYYPMNDTLFTVAQVLPSAALSGVQVAAVWMLFFAGRNRRYAGMSTAGLTVFQVMAILSLAIGAIGILSLFAVLVFFLSLAGGQAGAAATSVVLCCAGLLVLLLPFVLYQISVIRLLIRTKKTVLSGVPIGNGSLFVTVMCFVSAVCSGMMVALAAAGGCVFLAIGTGLQAVAQAAFGAVTLQHRTRMQELQFMNSYPRLPEAAMQGYYGVPAPYYGAVMPVPVQAVPAAPVVTFPAAPAEPVPANPVAEEE